ncbi:hypothetical protein KUV51_01210 [Tateyamaria omphalii]|uniref:hypothetical protein n=1 Tax=Tateyamaria omphalii TaxID=299262 RepID=UPI001C996B57|nr:hypothetical protein [Tateyamaria omphalii]MBY5931601.1 hypothetical protein [Tateyamaria omphalii]
MRWFAALAVCAVLAACAAPPEAPYASDARVASVAYREPGPATLTVLTMVSNRDGSGGHSALMINGSQRVIFDPAGSFVNDRVPEQDDVLYGVSPAVLKGYKSAHARSTYHVVSQTVEVTPEQAEMALRLAQSNGAVPRAFCTNANTNLLRQVPGFESIKTTFFPTNLMEQMASYPGVVEEKYFEDDEGTIVDGIEKLVIAD